MSKNLYDLREMLCEELDEYNRDAKNGLNERTLDTVHKLTDTIKNIDKIMMLEDGDYSRTGEWEADMRGSYGRTENYSRGNSYANRGRHYVRGHYSRDGAMDKMKRQLQEMLDDADDDSIRRAIQRCMDAIEG